MTDVFDAAHLVRDAAINAAYDLGLFDAIPESPSRRMRALLEFLAALEIDSPPPRPSVPRTGWGLLADVIRRDQPLGIENNLAYHEHLARVGAEAARELAALVPGKRVIDLGAGMGTYAAAYVDRGARATLVDHAEVLALSTLDAERIAGDIRTAPIGDGYDVALLANVLHLHDPATCAEIVKTAATAADTVVIKDLRRDSFQGIAFALNMALYTEGGDVYTATQLRAWLEAAGLVVEECRLASQPDGIVMIGRHAMPRSFRKMLAAAPDERFANHYTRVMPEMRREQLAHEMFTTPLDWDRLPRLSAVIDRLTALCAQADVRYEVPRARTLGALYERTHYGGFMPLLYGYPADLAYFAKRGRELGLDLLGTIDRYFAAPIVHELSHFGRHRDALLPPHLDECIAGWIGVHVWPEMAYPEGDHDDAIYAAPWLAQVGQAVARTYGIENVVRAHAGATPWDVALPKRFVERVTRFGWEDWHRRKTLHFLSDTFDPDPWINLVDDPAPDPAFDRGIVRDALRAMCLENTRVEGSFRTRNRIPSAPIVIDGWVRCATKSEIDPVAPRYWLPKTITAKCEIVLRELADIETHLLTVTKP